VGSGKWGAVSGEDGERERVIVISNGLIDSLTNLFAILKIKKVNLLVRRPEFKKKRAKQATNDNSVGAGIVPSPGQYTRKLSEVGSDVKAR